MFDNGIRLVARHRPLGMFRAVSCRDGASLERDGEPCYQVNELSSRTGRRQTEVLFADGTWFLVDPETDLVVVR